MLICTHSDARDVLLALVSGHLCADGCNGSRCAFGEATPRSSMTPAAVGTKQPGRDEGRFPDNPAEILEGEW